MKYEQVFDGDWVEPTPQRGHRMKCCDCSLIHIIDFRIKAGRVQFRPKRDKRATAAARRGLDKPTQPTRREPAFASLRLGKHQRSG